MLCVETAYSVFICRVFHWMNEEKFIHILLTDNWLFGGSLAIINDNASKICFQSLYKQNCMVVGYAYDLLKWILPVFHSAFTIKHFDQQL